MGRQDIKETKHLQQEDLIPVVIRRQKDGKVLRREYIPNDSFVEVYEKIAKDLKGDLVSFKYESTRGILVVVS